MKYLLSLLLIVAFNFSFGESLVLDQQPSTERRFEDNLNEKYSGSDFQYEEEKPPKPREKPSEVSKSATNGFMYFVKNIFPYLLGLIAILIILKAFVGVDINFWKSNKKGTLTKEALVYEEEIDENDYEALLKQALKQKNYRAAIRFYYLITLQLLADKKLIELHKEKTNADYLFEFGNHHLNKEFYHLSYIFSYVWYGEFSLDEYSFKTAEQKYQSFKSKLK